MRQLKGWFMLVVALYIAGLLFTPEYIRPLNTLIANSITNQVNAASFNYSFSKKPGFNPNAITSKGSIGTPIYGYEDLEPLFRAIRDVETEAYTDANCGAVRGNKPTKYGYAIGCFQIIEPYWSESGVGGSWEQVRDPQFAKRTMIGYWQRYEEYTNHALANRNWEVLAKTHYGGPSGWNNNPAANYYWSKVVRELQ